MIHHRAAGRSGTGTPGVEMSELELPKLQQTLRDDGVYLEDVPA